MEYISTRGKAPSKNFSEAVLAGLAEDGGLYVPKSLPKFTQQQIHSWRGLDYTQLAVEIIKPFVGDCLSERHLQAIVEKSYAEFHHTATAPLVQIDHQLWVLELFHGPTLAFKDFALQFLGNLLDHLLAERNQQALVLGATSGDTGSAAISGCQHCENLHIAILHPHERVSQVQRRQMTSVISDHVFNFAVRGNFDDCQQLVKQGFMQSGLFPQGMSLVAVNSINWARIMAQIVYYFYAALALGAPSSSVSFSVPTGNFGDIFAAYLAKKMGLPIGELIIATNANDILHRCLENNDHSKREIQESLSPSMDIMVSSNFERLLFDIFEQDGSQVRALFDQFEQGSMHLPDAALSQIRNHFKSYRCDDVETLDTIAQLHAATNYILDPHTATAVAAALANAANDLPMVCLATAHPAKFAEAYSSLQQVPAPKLPPHLEDLLQREERYTVIDNSLSELAATLSANISA